MRTLITTLVLLTAAGAAHASDAYFRGYGDIARAAHAMDDAARHFHQQLKYDIGRSHMTKDAKRLAKAARHFHRQVERGGSYRHLREDYADLARTYSHVSHEFAERHNLHHDRHFRRDFGAVARAFDDLRHAIDYAGGRHARYWHRDRHGWYDDRYDRRYYRPRPGIRITVGGLFDF